MKVNSFQTLKNSLSLQLKLPGLSEDFKYLNYAPDYALGAVLFQNHEGGICKQNALNKEDKNPVVKKRMYSTFMGSKEVSHIFV